MGTADRNRHPEPSHDSIVADWQAHAEEHDDANYDFLCSLKHRDYGFDPDEATADLHRQAFDIVDCTRCANCCKTMIVELDEADIERIARHLDMPREAFIETYLEPAEHESAHRMRERPCPFLGSDDLCTIYDVRPTGCREYPHTDKVGFTTRTMSQASNALQCPAVFWIVEQMRVRAGERRRRRRRRRS